MSRAVLLGVSDTRRTDYFKRAANETGLSLFFLDWNGWDGQMKQFSNETVAMKIDPPRWDSPYLKELDKLAADYRRRLSGLAQAADAYPIRFLNHPSAIAALLDKLACKETLLCAGLPVTMPFAVTPPHGPAAGEPPAQPFGSAAGCATIGHAADLLCAMQERGVCQVFVKPVNGSGAAGVSAFRVQPGSGRMALYTCAALHPAKGLFNTKRLRCFTDRAQILPLLDSLLQTRCIVERWYAKASHQGCSFDLRAVVQDGRIDYLLARLSKGPITNLQLNNRPLPFSALGLPASVQEEITALCQKAMGLFPGLRSAGIDILLEKESLTPRIIEMNGQGDLIYQDIFNENPISRRQAELLKRMGEP